MTKKTATSVLSVITACILIVIVILWDVKLPDNKTTAEIPFFSGGLQGIMDMLGKTENEAELPNGAVQDAGAYKSGVFEADILGNRMNVYFYFSFTEPYILREVFITTHAMTYSEIVDSLSRQYGEPSQQGREDNTDGEDDASEWTRYEVDNKIIEIGHGENNSYITMSIYIPLEY